MSVLIHPKVASQSAEIALLQLRTGLRAVSNERVAYLVTPSGRHPEMLRTPKPKKWTKPPYDWTPGPGGGAA